MHMHEERGGGSIVPSERRQRDGAGGGGPGAAGGAEGGLSAWSCAGRGPRQRAGPGQAEVSGLGGAGHRRQVRAAGAQVRQVRWQVRPVPGAGRGFASARLCRPPAGTCPLCRAVGLSYPSAKPLLGMAQGCEWPLGGLLSGGGWWALIPTCRSSSEPGRLTFTVRPSVPT